ncbi:hypothetical protein ACQ5SK_13660 [Bradyrhizobium japonicum]
MRNRFVLFSSALIVFTVAIFLFEAHAGAPQRVPEHCRLLDHDRRGIVLPVGGLQ